MILLILKLHEYDIRIEGCETEGPQFESGHCRHQFNFHFFGLINFSVKSIFQKKGEEKEEKGEEIGTPFFLIWADI